MSVPKLLYFSMVPCHPHARKLLDMLSTIETKEEEEYE